MTRIINRRKRGLKTIPPIRDPPVANAYIVGDIIFENKLNNYILKIKIKEIIKNKIKNKINYILCPYFAKVDVPSCTNSVIFPCIVSFPGVGI